MSKTKSETDTPKAPRSRRASIPIGPDAKAEIQHVAEAFNLPLAQVRDAAGEIASKAIVAGLRTRLGSARVEAAREELERLQLEMGGAAPVVEEVVSE